MLNYNEENLKDIRLIVEIVSSYNDDKFIIKFSPEVRYIHPLFFILLFDKCRSSKKDLILDIRDMNKNSQNYVHRFLTQYTDYEFFRTYTVEAKDNDYDLPYKEHLSNTYSLFTTSYHEKSWLSSNTSNILPIIRLKVFDDESERNVYHTGIKGIQERKSIYDLFTLSSNMKMNEYEKSLSANIDDMLDAVGIGKKKLSQPFLNLFSELIGNIQKHTCDDEGTNAHLSFYRDLDPIEKNIKLIVSDNYRFGFLDKYLRTLKCEKIKLRQKGIKTAALEPFTATIRDLKNGDFEKILKSLFGIKNVTEHQIPRIVMHFGIPTMLRILQNLLQDEQKAKIEVLANSVLKQQYYLVETIVTKKSMNVKVIPFNGKESINETFLKFNGTHIIISIPIDIQEYDTGTSDFQSNLNMSNNDFVSLLDNDNYENVQEEIIKFKYLHAKHIYANNDIDSDRVVVKYTDFQNNTFSDFIRALYLYAYQQSLVSIVVYNVPSNEFNEHLKLLYLIIYIKEEVQHDTSLDVVFYDADSPQAMFIGGRNQIEFCSINHSLGNKIENILPTKNKVEVKTKSPLVYQLKHPKTNIEHTIILPFELFPIYDEEYYDNSVSDTVEIFKDMILGCLDKFSIPMLVDTQRGYYLEKYYQFKILFQNSLWTHRIAFKLARLLKDKRYDYIIGTDKYTAPLISTLTSLLFTPSKYEIINNDLDRDWSQFNSKNVLILSSVTQTGENVEKHIYKKIDSQEKYIKDWFNVVRVQIDLQQNPVNHINSFISLNITETANDISSREKYKKLFEDTNIWKKPLYNLDSTDFFEISSFYRTDYKYKQIKGYTQKEKFTPKWINSAFFGHVIRGGNHYAFYTKTIQFLEDNTPEIQSYLEYLKTNIDLSSSDKSFIIAPMHHTNNNFTAVVNKEVFNNDAIVLSVDKTKGETNFHIEDLKSLIDSFSNNIKIYFVDDEISSIATLQYHYSWMKMFFGFEKDRSFDGIFTLIDRTSRESEIMINHYITGHEIRKRFLPFTTLEIKPIKSISSEECFLCRRKKEYQSLITNSALDLTRFELAEKVLKLKEQKANDIDNNDKVEYKKKIKDFIKMYAVHFVYQHFDRFTDIKRYYDVLKKFKRIIYKTLYEQEFKHYKLDSREQVTLRAILFFESEIAIIKALSFPKLSYYKSIRDTITEVLKKYIDQQPAKKFKIRPIIKSETVLEGLLRKMDPEKRRFLEEYKNKSNLHLANLHFSVLGYLGDPYLLGYACLALYAKMVELERQDISIKHGYLLAVKMVIADDTYKAKYLEYNLNIYEKDVNYYEEVPHLLRALFIENNIASRKEFKSIETIEEFQTYMNQDILNIDTESLTSIYINENLNKNIGYLDYIKKTQNELVDIFNNYHKINNDVISQKIKLLYFGAVSERNHLHSGHTEDVPILEQMPEDLTQIDDTWANYYCKETNSTIIRLVDIDEEVELLKNRERKENHPIWFKPIGCMVVKHLDEPFKENGFHQNHKFVINRVLANQKTIVEFIKKQTTTEVVKLRYENQLTKKNTRNLILQNKLILAKTSELQTKALELQTDLDRKAKIISNISHSYNRIINIQSKINQLKNKINSDDLLEMVGWYTKGLEFVFKLNELVSNELPPIHFLAVESSFKEILENFAKVSPYFLDNCHAKYNLTITENIDEKEFNIDDINHIHIIIFELFFNIIKNNKHIEGEIEIIITAENNTLYIANTGVDFKGDFQSFCEGTIDKDEKRQKDGKGLGIQKIYEYLSALSIKFNLIEDKDNIPIGLKHCQVVIEID